MAKSLVLLPIFCWLLLHWRLIEAQMSCYQQNTNPLLGGVWTPGSYWGVGNLVNSFGYGGYNGIYGGYGGYRGGYGYGSYFGYGTPMMCPGNVNTCYKYVCEGNGFFIQKGCLDPLSPALNCQIPDGLCRAQGGIGACFICSRNFCNGQATIGRGAKWPVLLTICALLFFAVLNDITFY